MQSGLRRGIRGSQKRFTSLKGGEWLPAKIPSWVEVYAVPVCHVSAKGICPVVDGAHVVSTWTRLQAAQLVSRSLSPSHTLTMRVKYSQST